MLTAARHFAQMLSLNLPSYLLWQVMTVRFCAGTLLNLSSTVSGGTTSYFYSWSGPHAFIPAVSNPSFIPAPFWRWNLFSYCKRMLTDVLQLLSTGVTINLCTTTLYLNMFIQGFYLGGGFYASLLFENELIPTATGKGEGNRYYLRWLT